MRCWRHAAAMPDAIAFATLISIRRQRFSLYYHYFAIFITIFTPIDAADAAAIIFATPLR